MNPHRPGDWQEEHTQGQQNGRQGGYPHDQWERIVSPLQLDCQRFEGICTIAFVESLVSLAGYVDKLQTWIDEPGPGKVKLIPWCGYVDLM